MESQSRASKSEIGGWQSWYAATEVNRVPLRGSYTDEKIPPSTRSVVPAQLGR